MEKLTTKQEKLLEIVKKNPGLSSRGIRIRGGYSESLEQTIKLRLTQLQLMGKLRCEVVERGGQVHSRCWWPT